MPGRFLIGIDVGGTFTDLTVFDLVSGATTAFKALSDRASPDRAVRAALAQSAVAPEAIELIMHGTTVATNALLERRGARTALVTTRGFRDVIELGRTTRLTPGSLYDPYFRKAAPLALRRDRHVVDERVNPDGSVTRAPDDTVLDALVASMRAADIESVAVCFLNAYANPANEDAAVARLRRAFDHVCGSAAVVNEAREYERFSTCVANAYVMPVMARYVGKLVAELRRDGYAGPFYTMASHGGLMSAAAVAHTPVRTMLSGPAGGLTAARHLMTRLGEANYITYDVGGTSSDVALIADAAWPLKRETILQGMIVRCPQLDIHTIGAGGGSIARLDAGGSLLVGPESAGSTPGPACYARGGVLPTLTDANVVLGRLGAAQKLGATLGIDAALARTAIESLARERDTDADTMAEGILRVANARMAAAIYEVSVARGFDPRDFALLPFGGAGPLHACDVADELGIPRVVVPPVPGAFSAFGTLCSGLLKDRSLTVLRLLDADAVAAFAPLFDRLAGEIASEFAAESVDTSRFTVERQVDARYAGQSYDLTVAIPPQADADAIRTCFEQAFEREYGRLDRDKAIEVVNLRVLGHVATATPGYPVLPSGLPNAAPIAHRSVLAGGARHDAAVYDRAALAPGQALAGPCIIEEMSATTWLPPGWAGHVGAAGELRLDRQSGRPPC
ncbi:MAG: hydantoinase/oxoprolinase family protein [Burkholderiales bacterium]|nr:hydantoinase/oxoprolinase family protein [Burkholderiales bacterium]